MMHPARAFRLRLAADHLLDGGVIAHPTESVWGLACLPQDEQAVERVLTLKGRDPAKGLILVSDCVERFQVLLGELPELARRRVLSSWPGATTWVLPDTEGWAPEWIRGAHDSVALRVSKHKLTASICSALDSPIVSTSANPAGRSAARSIWQARRYFGDDVDCYLAGDTDRLARPTTIRDAITGDTLRA